MRLDEDDLYDDYGQDSFDEEQALFDVINALKPEKVTEQQAEVELDKHDWDVDATIASLRKRIIAKNSKPESKGTRTNGKLTPLQMLAQRKRQELSQESPQGIPTQETLLQEPSSPQIPTPERTQAKPSLAALAAQRRGQVKNDTKLSALDKLRQQKRPPKQQTPPPQQQNPVPVQLVSYPDKPKTPKWQPEITFSVFESHLAPPSALGAVIGSSAVPGIHLQNTNTNFLATAKNAADEFKKPSPDDRVMDAQKSAFVQPGKPSSVVPTAGSTTVTGKQMPKNSSKTSTKLSTATATPTKASTAPEAQAAPSKPKSDLAERIANLSLKPHCSFVVIGHIDAGKSTLMGRLLLDTGSLNPKIVQKYEHESSKAGKSSFWLAWAMDATSEERERGVTVDIGEAAFTTEHTHFTVLDAPGHRDYVPNMIAGVAQADVALLVVDSDTNAFEAGFSLDGQTKEHAVLSRSLGIDRVVVAVNKMDLQNWDEQRFDSISSELTEFLTRKVGFQAQNIVFVPTSGIKGTNVSSQAKGDDRPKWYTGPSLVGALDEIALSRAKAQSPASKASVTQPFRFCVSNAFIEPFQSTITVSGRVLSGSVEAGTSDDLQIVNCGEAVRIKSIVDREFLVAGDQGELKIEVQDTQAVTVRAGDVIASSTAQLRPVQQFIAKIRLFDLPRPVLPGTPLAFHLGRVEDTVKVVQILGSLDKSTRKLRHLSKGTAARVVLQLAHPTVLTTPDDCKDLGRFVLRLNGATIGGGVVEQLE